MINVLFTNLHVRLKRFRMEMQRSGLVAGVVAALVAFFVFAVSKFVWKKSDKWIPCLRDRHVVITGASRGIGLALAMEALHEGAFVTLISYDSRELHQALRNITKLGSYSSDRICTKVADVGNYEAISKAIRECFEWRPIDIVICNAAVARTGYMDQLSVEDLDLVIRTNLSGFVYTIHAALPLMKGRGSQNPQSLVLMGSLGSLHPIYGQGIYTATKHAIKGIAECLRLELLPHNIRVTLSCPGCVKTPLLQEVGKDEALNEIMKVVDLYDPDRFDDPPTVARTTMQGVKEGRFLVTSKCEGLVLSAFCRGLFPAESVGRTVVEMMAFVVCRLGTHFFMATVQRSIRRQCRVRDGQREQNDEGIPKRS